MACSTSTTWSMATLKSALPSVPTAPMLQKLTISASCNVPSSKPRRVGLSLRSSKPLLPQLNGLTALCPLISSVSSGLGVNSKKWAKLDTNMRLLGNNKRYVVTTTTRCTGGNSSNDNDNSFAQPKAPFGYSRKDVLLIGLGVTLFGVALKSGLEYAGVDPLQAGNVVQLLVVLGMTVGWISSYMIRVASKDMTYAQQLRDYENKVMEKRLEGLTEAELQVLLEQVEEEKRGVVNGE